MKMFVRSITDGSTFAAVCTKKNQYRWNIVLPVIKAQSLSPYKTSGSCWRYQRVPETSRKLTNLLCRYFLFIEVRYKYYWSAGILYLNILPKKNLLSTFSSLSISAFFLSFFLLMIINEMLLYCNAELLISYNNTLASFTHDSFQHKIHFQFYNQNIPN